MELVQPIREKKVIENMKNELLTSKDYLTGE